MQTKLQIQHMFALLSIRLKILWNNRCTPPLCCTFSGCGCTCIWWCIWLRIRRRAGSVAPTYRLHETSLSYWDRTGTLGMVRLIGFGVPFVRKAGRPKPNQPLCTLRPKSLTHTHTPTNTCSKTKIEPNTHTCTRRNSHQPLDDL